MKPNTSFFRSLLVVFLALGLFWSCSKEVSFESGQGSGGNAGGTITDTAGNCQPATVKGQYKVDAAVTDSNYVLVRVNFTSRGTYKILSDTNNGLWFFDSGYVFSNGPQTIKLRAKGTPLLPGTTDYVYSFGGNTCGFSITATGGVNNGGSSASYLPTLAGGEIVYQLNPADSSDPTRPNDSLKTTISPLSFDYPSPTDPNRKTYYKYIVSPYTDTGFRHQSGNDYYALGRPEFDYFSIYDSVFNNIEYIYLKDNVNPGSPGATWFSDSVQVGVLDNNNNWTYGFARLRLTITAANASASFNNVLYTGVIVVKREIQFRPDPAGTPWVTVFEGQLSYAKGIGLVEQLFFDPGETNPFLRMTIRAWRNL
ncbi:MAG: hypothetical protein EAZ62_05385 [Sphingobacteriia bacterium]|nr:MAG: hypothetical protein EAZ62_05385 [Sphingobacteriia bacterium]